jgi:regulator of sirC expression with transglutaminase-like and TPR domain
MKRPAWFLAFCGACLFEGAAAADRPFLDRWLEFEQEAQVVATRSPTADAALREQMLAASRRLGAAVPARATGADRVQALNDFVFKELRIEASHDLADPENLLLSSILPRRRGYCIGIAALYLVLAEQVRLPVFAVSTPTHVFLRFDDGRERINIEPFQEGARLSDGEYARKHRISEDAVRRGVFLRNLAAGEFLALACNNLGVIHSERKEFAAAAEVYTRAIEMHPRLPAAHYNLGNDLLAQGRYRQAVREFSRALSLNPDDTWALNNRGLAHLKRSRPDRARRDFEAALGLDPAFEPARRNLEQVPAAL